MSQARANGHDASEFPARSHPRGADPAGALLSGLAQDQQEALRLLRGIVTVLRDRPSSKPSRATSALTILTSGTFAQYITTAMLLVYVLKGGDILTAIATVTKVFGGP